MKFCKLSRLRWVGHIRQDDDDLSWRVLLSKPGGKPPRWRPRLRWENGVKEEIVKLVWRNWTLVALNREGWRKLLKEAEATAGCSAVGNGNKTWVRQRHRKIQCRAVLLEVSEFRCLLVRTFKHVKSLYYPTDAQIYNSMIQLD